MSIEVRHARREELERVNELRGAVNDLHVQGRPGHFRPGFNAELQRRVYEQFDSDDYEILVALDDGAVAGFATFLAVRRPEGPYTLPLNYLHVEEFGVDAAHRRRGVGTALVKAVRDIARKQGLARVDLDAWSFNEGALAFYQAVGFRPYRVYLELDTAEPAE